VDDKKSALQVKEPLHVDGFISHSNDNFPGSAGPISNQLSGELEIVSSIPLLENYCNIDGSSSYSLNT
jgi:hypothetical protein